MWKEIEKELWVGTHPVSHWYYRLSYYALCYANRGDSNRRGYALIEWLQSGPPKIRALWWSGYVPDWVDCDWHATEDAEKIVRQASQYTRWEYGN